MKMKCFCKDCGCPFVFERTKEELNAFNLDGQVAYAWLPFTSGSSSCECYRRYENRERLYVSIAPKGNENWGVAPENLYQKHKRQEAEEAAEMRDWKRDR